MILYMSAVNRRNLSWQKAFSTSSVRPGLRPCGLKGLIEVIIWKLCVDDRVAMILQLREFDATWNAVPAVEEEDRGHGSVAIDLCQRVGTSPFLGLLFAF